MYSQIIYFQKPGKVNTVETLRAAKKRAIDLGIRKVIIASSHGYTALKAADIFKDTGIEIIAVGISNSFSKEGWNLKPDEKRKMEDQGIKVVVSHHGLEAGVSESFGCFHSPGNIIAETLRCFSQGLKVAVEVTIMAVEAGFVSIDSNLIAIGGTDEGADTAIVLKPAFAREFKNLKIQEIITKPYL